MKTYLNDTPGGYLTLILVALVMGLALLLIGAAPSIDEILRRY